MSPGGKSLGQEGPKSHIHIIVLVSQHDQKKCIRIVGLGRELNDRTNLKYALSPLWYKSVLVTVVLPSSLYHSPKYLKLSTCSIIQLY